MIKPSFISQLEWEEYLLRKQGKKKNYSVFTNRLKPKLIGGLEFFTTERRFIEKLLVPKSDEVKRTRRTSSHR